MTAEPLAPLDLAFWHIETPGHPLHLGALGIFTAPAPGGGAAAARHAAELLAARAAAVPGLRMRIRERMLPPGSAVRVPDPGFDPLGHVRLAPPAADFHTAAGPLMAAPLGRERPPWEAHVIPGAPGGGSFAVLFKFHHALADGMRALALAAALLDRGAAPDGLRRTPPPPPGPRDLLGALAPHRLPEAVRGGLRGVAHAAAEAARALDIGAAVARGTWDVRSTPALAAAPTGARATAGVRLDLDEVHRVRKVTGGTVNDVLIALVAGALRRWLDERGDGSTGVAPRALIPVSRRRPRTAQPGGNRLSGYLLRLPVAEPDPVARLGAVRAAMDRNKEAGAHRGAGAVALLADRLPPLGHRIGGPLIAQAARLLFDILVTSVPLPGLGLRLGGCPLAEVYPLAPLARGQSLAVAISTYQGSVHYGLLADAAAVPDLPALAAAVPRELAALQRATHTG
ncbi:wax ester/triacylglycerol synthase family O-acyltransferase [Streptomyces sp. NPDC050560]|uniref:wax ester/triacylglycerol synthase family O-acyltransferase n=1 Tax=Streptomyces sp. NPDC050560 TaxID=3365630 RepID=UPI0037877DB5